MSEHGFGVPSTGAVRLTFVYEGDRLTLVDRRTLEVVIPPSDDVPSGEAGGVWVEVRSDQEQVLHRRVMPDPWRPDAEVFSPAAEQNVARVPVDQRSGTFSILVPAPEEADHVTLMGASTPAVARVTASDADGPVEIARFPLRQQEGGS